LVPQLRAAIWEVDPNVPTPTLEKMEDRIAADLHDPRFHSVLLGVFSVSALILTLAGIYGLMLYLVAGSTREIGIRTALGARPRHVLWTISQQCVLLISLGLATGIAAAVGTTRLLGSLLFAVSPLDAPTFALMAAGLGSTALLACLVPAWRATLVQPTTALRSE
jgi:ABC-type antimicrobial peptide transport system permease subunit